MCAWPGGGGVMPTRISVLPPLPYLYSRVLALHFNISTATAPQAPHWKCQHLVVALYHWTPLGSCHGQGLAQFKTHCSRFVFVVAIQNTNTSHDTRLHLLPR